VLRTGFPVALVMNPVSLIHSTRQRVWAVLIVLAILGVGIASFLLWKSQPVGIEDLYGLWD